MKLFPVVSLSLLSAATAFAAPAAKIDPNDAKAVMDKVRDQITAKDEVATVKMTILEKDGTKKERTMEIKRKGEGDKQKVLVRIEAPADLKGTGLLSVNKGKQSDQWLFLPSSKQTRRIQSGNRSAGFLDSELTYEDMGSASDTKADSKVLRQEKENGKDFDVIETKLTGESAYGRVVTWVDLSNYLVTKSEAFDKKDKPLKNTVLSDYKAFGNGVWRAQKVEVKNVQNGRGTNLEMTDLKLNKGISDSEFTETALSDAD